MIVAILEKNTVQMVDLLSGIFTANPIFRWLCSGVSMSLCMGLL